MDEKNDIMSRIAKAKTKEELSALYVELVGKYKEVIKASPKLASALVKQGYKDAVKAIDDKVNEVKSDLAKINDKESNARENLADQTESREQKNQDWQSKHENRSKVVKGAVDKVHKSTITRKAKIAVGTITLSTLAAKGARLFGAKGLADKMQQRGTNYANALMTKDSRMDKFAERMAENGFVAADNVRGAISTAIKNLEELAGKGGAWVDKKITSLKKTKNHIETKMREAAKAVKDGVELAGIAAYVKLDDTVKTIKDGAELAGIAAYVKLDDTAKAVKKGVNKVGQTISSGVKSVKQGIDETKTDISNIGKDGKDAKTSVEQAKQARYSKAENWRGDNRGRTGIILDAVQRTEEKAADRKARHANRIIALSTVSRKAVRLFGAKGLSEKMKEASEKRVSKIMGSESKAGKVARTVAKRSFDLADGVEAGINAVKTGINNTKTDISDIGKEGKTFKEQIADKTTDRHKEAEQWRSNYRGRSGIILDAVQRTEEKAADRKARHANRIIALSTVSRKAVRLVGAKGLSDKIKDTAERRATKIMNSESKLGKVAKAAAKGSFEFADGVEKTVNAGISNAKKGAIAVGKVAMVPVAGVHAIGSLTLGLGAKAGEKIGEKYGELKEGFGEYKEIAGAKVQNVRSGMKIGFNSRVGAFLAGMSEKISEAADNFKSKAQREEDILAAAKAKREEQTNAQEKDSKDTDGPEI